MLSDHEQDELIFDGIAELRARLADAGRYTPAPSWLDEPRRYAEKLWPAFRAVRNCATDDMTSRHGPWTAAVAELCRKERADVQRQAPAEDDGRSDNPLCGPLSVPALLQTAAPYGEFAAMYNAYRASEAITMVLPREYDRDYESLARVLANFQGACYTAFRQHEIFARAHVLHDVLTIIYGGLFGPYDDELGRLLVVHHAHHGLQRPMEPAASSLAECLRWHRKLFPEPNLRDRIDVAAQISGGKMNRPTADALHALATLHRLKLDVKGACARALKDSTTALGEKHRHWQEENDAAVAATLHGELP